MNLGAVHWLTFFVGLFAGYFLVPYLVSMVTGGGKSKMGG